MKPYSDNFPEARRRREAILGIRNCLEFLLEEIRMYELKLPAWLVRITIAALNKELDVSEPSRSAGSGQSSSPSRPNPPY